MRKLALASVVVTGLSACAVVPVVGPGGGKCFADPGQQWIGQPATFENGQKILDSTKSATFRWAGPGKVLTQELDPNRVTVYYDSTQTVTKVVCG